jgi:transcription antitermination factor NusA-like protein
MTQSQHHHEVMQELEEIEFNEKEEQNVSLQETARCADKTTEHETVEVRT